MNPGHWHSITPKIAAEIRKARCAKGWTVFDLRRELNDWLVGEQVKELKDASALPDDVKNRRSFSEKALYRIEAGVPHKINSVRAAAFVAVLGIDFWAQPERKSLWLRLGAKLAGKGD